MKGLQSPEKFLVRSAQGWLELGLPLEAASELRKVRSEDRDHPLVLHEWWHVHGRLKDFENCLEISRKMMSKAPHLSWGWFMLSWTFYCQGKTEEAYENLLLISEQFP